MVRSICLWSRIYLWSQENRYGCLYCTRFQKHVQNKFSASGFWNSQLFYFSVKGCVYVCNQVVVNDCFFFKPPHLVSPHKEESKWVRGRKYYCSTWNKSTAYNLKEKLIWSAESFSCFLYFGLLCNNLTNWWFSLCISPWLSKKMKYCT